jgi:hypothetical protein
LLCPPAKNTSTTAALAEDDRKKNNANIFIKQTLRGSNRLFIIILSMGFYRACPMLVIMSN